MQPARLCVAADVFALGDVEKEFVRQSRENFGSLRSFLGVRMRASASFVRQRLPAALDAAQSKHPMLACVLAEDATLGGLVLKKSLAHKIPVTAFAGARWTDVFQRMAKAPLALGTLPMEVFYTFDDEEAHVDLFLVFEHYCGDGASMKTLLNDVLNHMTGKDTFPPGPGYVPTPFDRAIQLTAEARWGALQTMLRTAAESASCLAGHLLQPSEALRVRVTESEASMGRNNSTFVTVDAMSPAETRAFTQGCKRLGVPVTGAITAVYLEALAAVIVKSEPFQLSVGMTTSARFATDPMYGLHEMTPVPGTLPYFRTGKVYGNHCKPLDRVVHVALQLGQMLKYESSLDRQIVRSLQTPFPVGLGQHRQRFAPSLMITALGIGPIKRTYGDVAIDMVYTAVNVNCSNWPLVLVNTEADRLTATLLAPTPRFAAEDLTMVQAVAWRMMLDIASSAKL